MRDIKYNDKFFDSLHRLTEIPVEKIKEYANGNNPFNILEHPLVINPDENQLEKIKKLNDFISSYSMLREIEEQNKIVLNTAEKAGNYFKSLLGSKRDKECLMVAFVDNSIGIIEQKILSEGTVDHSVVYPREILKRALYTDCAGIIISHNHPGGSLRPSRDDIKITKRLVDIFEPLDIKVFDHIIIGGNKYLSMLEEGLMPNKENAANYEPIKIHREEQMRNFEAEYER